MEKILELPSCYDSKTVSGEIFSIPFADVRDFCPNQPLQDDSVWEQLMGCPRAPAAPAAPSFYDSPAMDEFLPDIADPRKAGPFEELLEEGSFMDMPLLPGFDTSAHTDNHFAQANMALFPDMALEEAFHTMGIQSSMSEPSEVSEAWDGGEVEGMGGGGAAPLPIHKSMSFPEAGASEGQPAQRRRRLTESDHFVLHEIHSNMSLSFSPKAAALRRSLGRK